MKDPKDIVREGYNALGVEYTGIRKGVHERDEKYIAEIFERVPEGSKLLDLGCGGGLSIPKRFSERYSVTGVDISPVQIELARENVPKATFHCMDMMDIDSLEGPFDAVTAFFSIIHVPREEHALLFGKIADLLTPGGVFFAILGPSDTGEHDVGEFLGTEMYWSHYDAETNLRMLRETGFKILKHSIEGEDFAGEYEEHLYVLSVKR
jgi:cyclopropane fatty-acyl-phospholipid synthase-like methyltransferase